MSDDRQDGFWWVRLNGGRWVCGELVTLDRAGARFVRVREGSFIVEAVTQWGPYVPPPDDLPGVEQ